MQTQSIRRELSSLRKIVDARRKGDQLHVLELYCKGALCSQDSIWMSTLSWARKRVRSRSFLTCATFLTFPGDAKQSSDAPLLTLEESNQVLSLAKNDASLVRAQIGEAYASAVGNDCHIQ